MKALTPSEWLVLRSVWDLGEGTAFQVSQRLAYYGRTYDAKTVGIFLSRIARMGYLEARPVPVAARGRARHVYRPLLSMEEALQVQVAQFLRVHGIEAETCARALEAFMEAEACEPPAQANVTFPTG